MGALLSDGTGVWWAASQMDKGADASASVEGVEGSRARPEGAASASRGIDTLLGLKGLQSTLPAYLADEALAQWLGFFAGHKKTDGSAE